MQILNNINIINFFNITNIFLLIQKLCQCKIKFQLTSKSKNNTVIQTAHTAFDRFYPLSILYINA